MRQSLDQAYLYTPFNLALKGFFLLQNIWRSILGG